MDTDITMAAAAQKDEEEEYPITMEGIGEYLEDFLRETTLFKIIRQLTEFVNLENGSPGGQPVHREKRLKLQQNLLDSLLKDLKACDYGIDKHLNVITAAVVDLMFVYVGDARIEKKLEKVYHELESISATQVEKELERHVDASFIKPYTAKRKSLLKWCMMLEHSVSGRFIVEQHLQQVTSSMCKTLKHLVDDAADDLPVELQDHVLHVVKFMIQLLRFLGSRMHDTIWCLPTAMEIDVDVTEQIILNVDTLINWLIKIMMLKKISRECQLLAGTAMAMLLNLHPDPHLAAKTFIRMYSGLGTDEEIQFGNITIKLGPKPANHDLSYNTSSSSLARRTPIGAWCDDEPDLMCEALDKEDKLWDAFRKDKQTSFSHIAMLNGVICCGREDILCQPLGAATSSRELLILLIFPQICQFCQAHSQYYSYQLLSQWYRKARNILEMIHATPKRKRKLSARRSNFTLSTLQILWNNLDSPVDGVPNCIQDIFASYLGIIQAERRLFKDQENYLDDLVAKLVNTSLHAKGKYRLLATLIPYVGDEKLLQKHPEICDQLLQSLASNTLGPCAKDMYKVFMMELKARLGKDSSKEDKERVVKIWERHWLQCLLKGLCHDVHLVRTNTVNYWVPITFDCLPTTFHILLQQIESELSDSTNAQKGAPHGGCKVKPCRGKGLGFKVARHRLLFAWISVMKTARASHLVSQLPQDPLHEALYHSDEDVRAGAFTLICVTNKKSEPLSAVELSLLKECLPFNLNVDSPVFRHQLHSCMKAVLVRARDGALSTIKDQENKKKKHTPSEPNSLRMIIEFVDWLLELSLMSMYPGACYQRKKTAMDWLGTIYDSSTHDPTSQQRKSITPGTVQKLLEMAQSAGLWNLHSPEYAHALITCVLDGTNEIREMSAQLLLMYFPWPIPVKNEDEAGDIACHILASAIELCNSPRSHECESGALLCSLVFRRYVLDNSWSFNITHSDGKWKVKVSTEVKPAAKVKQDGGTSGAAFVKELLKVLQYSLELGKTNPLKAAMHYPGFGLLLAVGSCVTSVPYDVLVKHTGSWLPCVRVLMRVTGDMVDTVMLILSGNSNTQGTSAPPSFQQMGMAIQDLISASSDDHDDSGVENIALSPEHQLVLSWCWHNIKESATLLSKLVETLPVSTGVYPGLLSIQNFRDVGQIFYTIFTQCRHRGAIESCNSGFTRFCSHLLKSSNPEIYSIPREILQKVLSMLVNVCSQYSVTRRSAGLPILVQCVLTSEGKMKKVSLLEQTVVTLLDIVQEPIPNEFDQRLDLPQVHAMNILKALFRDAGLVMSMLVYLPTAVIQAITGFSSPSWAIRNAATQLLGVLECRMIGQNKCKTWETMNMVTAPEFFAHYPDLQLFFLRHLEAAQDTLASGRLQLHPSLFPIISLLSKLGPGVERQREDSVLQKFKAPVVQLASSPTYQVRELAAAALLPLLNPDEVDGMIEELITTAIPPEADLCPSFNRLHGTLLQIERLWFYFNRSAAPDARKLQVYQKFLDQQWLAGEGNPCDLIRAKYMEVAMTMTSDIGGEDLLSNYSMILSSAGALEEKTAPLGSGLLEKQMKVLFLKCSTSGHKSLQKVNHCLQSGNHEIRSTCIEYLQSAVEEQAQTVDFWQDVQESLFQLLLTEDYQPCLVGGLKLVVQLHQQYGCTVRGQFDQVWLRLVQLMLGRSGSTASACAVPALAVLVAHYIRIGKFSGFKSHISGWCEELLRRSKPSESEISNQQSAKALQIAGAPLLIHLKDAPIEPRNNCVTRIYEAGLNLLQNEDSDVRRETAGFVSQLPGQTRQSQYQDMYSSYALEALCDFMAVHFNHAWPSFKHIFSHLMDKLSMDYIRSRDKADKSVLLFEPEEDNIYAERATIVGTLYKCLKDFLSYGSLEVDVADLETKLAHLAGEMKVVRDHLATECQDVPMFNTSINNKVYSTTSGVLLAADILIMAAHLATQPQQQQQQQEQDDTIATHLEHLQELKDAVQDFTKVTNLHPQLLRLVQRIQRSSTR